MCVSADLSGVKQASQRVEVCEEVVKRPPEGSAPLPPHSLAPHFAKPSVIKVTYCGPYVLLLHHMLHHDSSTCRISSASPHELITRA